MDSQIARFTGIINNIKIDSKGLLNDLKKLFFFYARKRDKEMLIELLFQVQCNQIYIFKYLLTFISKSFNIFFVNQGITGEILKEIITIFYEPLAKVYKVSL